MCLGRQQARQTGKRLRQLNLPYNKVVSSTMQRALETTDCILESIPQIPHTHDDMLVEGAPYRPEPPSAEWKPSAKVDYYFVHTYIRSLLESSVILYEMLSKPKYQDKEIL